MVMPASVSSKSEIAWHRQNDQVDFDGILTKFTYLAGIKTRSSGVK